jgi:predicted PurR-regulated permease PerM
MAHKIEMKLGAWVRGEIILMLIVGLTTYIGLTILGVEYALPLAVIAGVLELVPTIGPIISSIPAILIALVQGPVLAIAVLAMYILIQQAENNFLVPKVMEKAVGVLPLITIASLLIGGTLFGVIGAVIAVPAVVILHVLFEEYVESRKA